MRSLTAFALILGLAAASAPAQSEHFDAAWSLDRLWDDGQGEISRYDAVTRYEGQAWEHEVVTIVISEPFSNTLWVKADHPDADDIPVIKMNIVFEVPTRHYDTRVMSSVFIPRSDPAVLVKQAVSTQEWCGTSFFEVQGWTDPPTLVWNTYWDGEGRGERPLDELGDAGLMTTEQLLLSLRALRFEEGLTLTVPLLDSLHDTARLDDARVADAGVTVAALEEITLADGAPAQAWRVHVEPALGPAMDLWFLDNDVRTLARLERPDARGGITQLTLRETSRWQYW
jgi:hypothetical protein